MLRYGLGAAMTSRQIAGMRGLPDNHERPVVQIVSRLSDGRIHFEILRFFALSDYPYRVRFT